MSDNKQTPLEQQSSEINAETNLMKKVFLEGQMLSARFGSMITILMQSQEYMAMPLKDLKDRFVPPLQLNQYRLAEAQNKETGETVPVALILWASVSDDLHEKISANPANPIILKNQEWMSGANLWIVDAVGPKRFLTPLLTALRNQELAGKNVHYRAMFENQPMIKTFDHPAEQNINAPDNEE